jgi:hypothetical protein
MFKTFGMLARRVLENEGIWVMQGGSEIRGKAKL